MLLRPVDFIMLFAQPPAPIDMCESDLRCSHERKNLGSLWTIKCCMKRIALTKGRAVDYSYALVFVSCVIAFGILLMWLGLRG